MSERQSPEHRQWIRRLKKQTRWVRFWQLTLLLGFIFLWEGAVRLGWIDPFLFSSPTHVWQEAVKLSASGELWRHIWITSLETVCGFLLGTASGIGLATLIWFSPFLSRVLDPYLVILNSMPKVALGPLFIVALGAGFISILAMAVAITIIITTLVIHTRFRETDRNLLILARSFGATRGQLYRMIIFPSAIPDMLAALKVNVGLAWVGVIVGEFLVSKGGLGYLIIYGFQVFNLHLVMLSLVIVAVIATGMYQGIAWLEARLPGHRQSG
ncbi:ABC transporter permease [Staphylospora marina]|uniref:ABC transporter permease n=1 Tax=Staphylospora marina TaxID=2490858 RepID=UPI000F5BE972|nr:ABC transporter permease [Staphylospora marina]